MSTPEPIAPAVTPLPPVLCRTRLQSSMALDLLIVYRFQDPIPPPTLTINTLVSLAGIPHTREQGSEPSGVIVATNGVHAAEYVILGDTIVETRLG